MRPLTRLALAFAVGVSVGCFSDRLAPPTFRYSCKRDADCAEPESCIRGLCQIPCTHATFEEDCPTAGSFAACFNGTCSNVCTVGADHCPAPQSCIDLSDLGIDLGGGGGGGFGGPPPDLPLGICGVQCQPGDDVCPAGEACAFGFCVQTCELDVECQRGFACFAGLCLPEGFEGPDGSGPETGGTETGGTETGGTETGGTETGGTETDADETDTEATTGGLR